MPRARLRNVFHYPADDDLDDLPPHMDEEEQEALIALLRATDTSTNELYSTIFSLIFVLPALHSLLVLFSNPTLLNILALSSFIMTIYTVRFIPVPSKSQPGEGSGGASAIDTTSSASPIDRFLPILNGVLSLVVCLGAYVENSKPTSPLRRGMVLEGWAGYLPLVVYIMSVIIRYAMTPLDLEELEKMKYKYKGA